jgi:hypothetical protein
MVVAKQANIRYKTISAALNIIDPEGAFLPGTIEHNWLTESILTWIKIKAVSIPVPAFDYAYGKADDIHLVIV